MLLLTLLLACTNTRTSDGPESGGTSPDSRASDTSALESVPSLPADTEADADDADGCPAVYDQDELPAFDLQISDTEWAALQADYSYGTKAWHPAVFTGTLNGETVTMADAAVRLSGNPGFSWIGPKMQFAISFTQTDPDARYHGLRKLKLDASWYDPSLIRDRLAYAYLRDLGVAAPCANNATLSINGAMYGLYKNVEFMDQEFLERTMGRDASGGVLWKYGSEASVNEADADPNDMAELWSHSDVAWQADHTDLPANLLEWAGEALIPQDDGYWCCSHNFYIYQHPTQGIQFLPWDMDYTFDSAPYFADPDVFYRDSNNQPHLDAVAADPVWGPRWVAALQTATDAYDPDVMEQRIDDWSAQTAAAFDADPTTTVAPEAHADALARLKGWTRSRSAFMKSWMARKTAASTGDSSAIRDSDADGYTTQSDCDDADPDIHPDAAETCNRRDDDCNGLFDDHANCDTCEAYSFGASHFLVCGDPVDQRTARLTCSAAGGTLGYPASTEDWYLIVYTTYWQEHAWSGYSAWWADPGYGGCQALAPASWSSTAVDCAAKLPVLCRVP